MSILAGLGLKAIAGLASFGKWLRSLPWYAFVIAALAIVAALQYSDARHWRKVADRRQATIDATVLAQKTADDAARARNKRVAAGHAANSKETTNDAKAAHAGADRVADTLRLRVAQLERAARNRPLPGPGCTAGGANEEVDYRLSLSDELTLRRQCEAQRIDRDALIDWETRRLEIETAPQ